MQKLIKGFQQFVNENRMNEADAKNKLSAEDLKEIGTRLRKIIYNYDGSYWNTLSDPQQTHAIYGVSSSNVDRLKEDLIKAGAKKFRIVKKGGIPIICFDASKMIN